jgi:hypothetical protein
MICDQRVQQRKSADLFREPTADQDPAPPVLQLDIVLGLSPTIPEEQHRPGSLRILSNHSSGGSSQRPNGSVLPARGDSILNEYSTETASNWAEIDRDQT